MNPSSKMLTIQCPECGAAMKRSRASIGKESKCKDCGGKFLVPGRQDDPFDYASTLSRLTGDYSEYLQSSADPLDNMKTLGADQQPGTGQPKVNATETSELKLGSMIDDRYIVTGRLGSGAMGSVYRVIDTQTEAEYAIKVLTEELRGDAGAVRQLHRELAISQNLTHPQLLRINHFDSTADHSFIVMEYIPGKNLEELRLLRGGKLSEQEVRTFLTNIAVPLDYLHDQGIVHLDLKPHNLIYVGDDLDGQLKIADFGISRSLKEQIGRRSNHFDLQGTLCYMAPEQLKNQVCDRRTDIYALGIILHQLLTGEFPFPLTKPEEIIAWHIGAEARFSQSGPLWKVIKGCLSRDPNHRFASCTEVLQSLSAAPASSKESQQPFSLFDEEDEDEEDEEDEEDFAANGFELLDSGDLEAAYQQFEKALDFDRKDTAAIFGRSVYFEKTGDIDRAISEVSAAIDLSGQVEVLTGLSLQCHEHRAKLFTTQKKYANAVADWDRAIDELIARLPHVIDEDVPSAEKDLLQFYLLRGNVYFAMKEWDKALIDYKSVLQSNQDHWSAWYNSGLVHENKEMYETAIGEFTRAYQIAPDDMRPLTRRGYCYLRLGQLTKGGEDLNLAEAKKHGKADFYRTKHRRYRVQHDSTRMTIALSSKLGRLAALPLHQSDGTWIWDITSNQLLGETNLGSGWNVMFSPHSPVLLVGHTFHRDADQIFVYDSTTLEQLDRIILKEQYSLSGFTEDGGSAILHQGNGFCLMNLKSRNIGLTFKCEDDTHKCCMAGNVFVTRKKTNSSEELICFWDLRTGKEINRVSIYRCDAVSPDGRYFVGQPTMVGGLKLMAVASGKVVCDLPDFHARKCVFSPDGEYIAATGYGTSVCDVESVTLWSLARRAVECKFLSHRNHEHDDEIDELVFSADGKLLASADLSTVRLWETGI